MSSLLGCDTSNVDERGGAAESPIASCNPEVVVAEGRSFKSALWCWSHYIVVVFSLCALLAAGWLTVRFGYDQAFDAWLVGTGTLLVWATLRSWSSFKFSLFDSFVSVALLCLAAYFRTGFDILLLPGDASGDEILIATHASYFQGAYQGILRLYWVALPVFGLALQVLGFQFYEPSVTTARIVHGLFSALAVVALYDLGRNLVNRRVGVAAAVLLAVSASSIAYSRTGLVCIQTATFGTAMMAFMIRAVNGGASLCWVGASVCMAFGMMSYQAGYILPIALVASMLPYVTFAPDRSVRLKVIKVTVSVVVIGLLIACPPYLEIWNRFGSSSAGRNADLFLSSHKLAELGKWYLMPTATPTEVFIFHAKVAARMLWNGWDSMPIYGVYFGLVDSNVTYLLWLAPLFLLRSRRVGWMCFVWIVGYITFGCVLCATAITYHRILTVVPFACLAAAAIIDAALPRWAAVVGLIVLCCLSANSNLNYYFTIYPKQRPPAYQMVMAHNLKQYGSSYVLVDASRPDTLSFPDAERLVNFYRFETKIKDIIRVSKPSDIWKLGETKAEKVILVTSSNRLSAAGILPSSGYSIKNMWQHEARLGDGPLLLNFFELQKL